MSRGTPAEIGRISQTLVKAGVEIRTLSRAYDLASPDDELFYTFVTALARRELGKYKERAKLKLDEMLRKGRSRNGAVPFGYAYDRKDQRIFPDPDCFPVLKALIRDAFSFSDRQLAARYGLTVNQVARALKSSIICGYPARQSAPWPEWERGCRRLPWEEWEWPEQPGNYEAAISREEWERLQRARESRRKGRNRPFSPHGWCRDRLHFAGTPDDARPRLGNWRSAPRYYPTYELSTPAPPLLYINRETVHQRAQGALQAAFDQPAALAAAVRLYRRQVAEETDAQPADEAPLLKEITRLRAELDELALLELRASDPERRAAYGRTATKIEAELGELKGRLLALARPRARVPELDQVLADVPELIAVGWERIWEEVSARGQERALVNAFLRRIEVVVEAGSTNRQYRREVVGVAPALWLEPFLTGY